MLPDPLPHEIIAAFDRLARLGQAIQEAQAKKIADSGSLGGVALSASEPENQQRSSSSEQFYRGLGH